MFGEVKNRDLQRINKENSVLAKIQQNGRIDDRMIKRQIMKACKKIQKAFRGVIDEEDYNNDIEKEVSLSEIHLNLVHGEGPIPKKNMFNLTGKNKLLEAAFKEKEFDPYFCLSLVLTVARTLFI